LKPRGINLSFTWAVLYLLCVNSYLLSVWFQKICNFISIGSIDCVCLCRTEFLLLIRTPLWDIWLIRLDTSLTIIFIYYKFMKFIQWEVTKKESNCSIKIQRESFSLRCPARHTSKSVVGCHLNICFKF